MADAVKNITEQRAGEQIDNTSVRGCGASCAHVMVGRGRGFNTRDVTGCRYPGVLLQARGSLWHVE